MVKALGQTPDSASARALDQALDQDVMETPAADPDKSAVVVRVAGQTVTVTMGFSEGPKLNSERVSYSNRNRNTPKKPAEIRSRARSCCASCSRVQVK